MYISKCFLVVLDAGLCEDEAFDYLKLKIEQSIHLVKLSHQMKGFFVEEDILLDWSGQMILSESYRREKCDCNYGLKPVIGGNMTALWDYLQTEAATADDLCQNLIKIGNLKVDWWTRQKFMKLLEAYNFEPSEEALEHLKNYYYEDIMIMYNLKFFTKEGKLGRNWETLHFYNNLTRCMDQTKNKHYLDVGVRFCGEPGTCTVTKAFNIFCSI